MIEGVTIKNGTIKLVLTGSDPIDEEILKTLNGATCRLISDNYRVGDKSITGGLIIEQIKTQKKDESSS